jgi:hypothetical protein
MLLTRPNAHVALVSGDVNLCQVGQINGNTGLYVRGSFDWCVAIGRQRYAIRELYGKFYPPLLIAKLQFKLLSAEVAVETSFASAGRTKQEGVTSLS